jgi:hypothetical protein
VGIRRPQHVLADPGHGSRVGDTTGRHLLVHTSSLTRACRARRRRRSAHGRVPDAGAATAPKGAPNVHSAQPDHAPNGTSGTSGHHFAELGTNVGSSVSPADRTTRANESRSLVEDALSGSRPRLQAHWVRCVVIGGVAVPIHNLLLSATVDIDVTPSQDPKNLERLPAAFDGRASTEVAKFVVCS